MARSVRRFAKRKGATIVLVALSVAAILAMGAITVDLGMLFKIRGDAQRVADAAALAGASAYLDYSPLDARIHARDRAVAFIDSNYVGGSKVDTTGILGSPTLNGNTWIQNSPMAKIEIAPDIYRVRVTIRRPNNPSLFGTILGVMNTPIQAYAAAEAVNAGGAKCVRPFALADTWEEGSADKNGNNFWDTGEDWSYDPGVDPGDSYAAWDGTEDESDNTAPLESGYGSVHRNDNGDPITYDRDWGRQLIIKPQNPQVDQVIKPGHFFVWDMPDDPIVTTTCANSGGSGAQDYEHNICECNDAEVYLDTEYDIKPGNMVGPTQQGFKELIAQDPSAQWVQPLDGSRGYVKNTNVGDANWQDGPRVIKVALYDPAEEYKSGRIGIKFNNIALMFVEAYKREPGGKEDAVYARFITYAKGSATPGPGGPLAKVLRLVE